MKLQTYVGTKLKYPFLWLPVVSGSNHQSYKQMDRRTKNDGHTDRTTDRLTYMRTIGFYIIIMDRHTKTRRTTGNKYTYKLGQKDINMKKKIRTYD